MTDLRRRASAGEKKASLARGFGISRETLYPYLRATPLPGNPHEPCRNPAANEPHILHAIVVVTRPLKSTFAIHRRQ